jgi:2-oxoisovalerate dehydrogenase E2 component (dihydrolipoyl transacylase)
MSTFKLPDLGEGLAEAEILQWHVKPGDRVVTDQPMISVETAKAVVEVPVPFSGVVGALHGAVGDILATGAHLIDIDTGTGGASPTGGTPASSRVAPLKGTALVKEVAAANGATPINGATQVDGASGTGADSGTVVGTMPATSEHEWIETATPASPHTRVDSRTRALPITRALAKRLGLDLSTLTGSGADGVIRLDDVLAHSGMGALRNPTGLVVPQGAVAEPLRGARRAMAHSMSTSRDQVSGSTVCDDADIHSWSGRGAYMLRLIRAMAAGCAAEPALNAWYDSAANSRVLHARIDLAIAVDTPSGLIVPVLRDIKNQSSEALRAAIAAHKEAAHRRTMAPEELRDFTLMLSNFGTLAGRYGIPLVVPPAVAILGAGKVREDAVALRGTIVAHRRMPLSLSFDHRCITGGEACRFLAAVIEDLEKPD